MEEIVARNTRLFFGTLIFCFSIAFGMHVAGQTPPPGAPPLGGAPALPGLPPTMPTVGAPAAGTALPADLQNALNGARGGQPLPGGAAPATGKDMVPAFGPAALQHLESPEEAAAKERAKEHEKEKAKSAVFVPSDVETIIPHQVKQSDPRAVLRTSMGDITIRLFQNYAPKNVHAFIDLARGDREFTDVKTGRTVRRPFYVDLTFHRVVNGFLIQTGCPLGNGRGGPGFSTADEVSQTLQFNKPGIVAMAPQREGKSERKDSNGSQFFITVAPMPEWDGKFTIIGEVEKGMRVVNKISQARTGPTERPIKRVFLNSVEIFDEPTPNMAGDKKEPAQ